MGAWTAFLVDDKTTWPPEHVEVLVYGQPGSDYGCWDVARFERCDMPTDLFPGWWTLSDTAMNFETIWWCPLPATPLADG